MVCNVQQAIFKKIACSYLKFKRKGVLSIDDAFTMSSATV